jgi:hypothetical protein
MECLGITVLGILDQKNDEEGDYRCGGVDDKLPGIREMEIRAQYRP